jgi:hypothetical protein
MLASLKNAKREGRLVLVQRDLQRTVDAASIALNNAGHSIADWVAETLGGRSAKCQRPVANANAAN